MAITHGTPIRNALATEALSAIDAGAGNGKVLIYTAGFGTLLAELTFSKPAFGTPVNGTATAAAITQDSSANASGTAAVFRVTDSADNVVFSGTVGTSNSDMLVASTAIVAGQPATITSFLYSASV